ncbi:MAG: protein kinase, partial [Deltaproteobacteria bacterium]
VVDFGRAQGRYYLATEYLEGRPLVRVMIDAYNRENNLDDAVIAAVGADVANGLFAAHTATNEQGEPLEVVHRDVSPQNIFVTYRGVSKVIDFGVAKATERVSKTEVGFVKGKAAYMSPEQAEGRSLDAKSDVFSLGVCLWEMRAGQRLFKRDNEYDTLLAVQSATIPPPSSMRGKPNPVLDHIILGALERNLDKRTASAQQLARQLIDYATGVGVTHRSQVVSGLLERLFGSVAAQERALIVQLEEGGASREDAQALEALSGVSHRTNVKRITMVAEPESLSELDDFGTERPDGENTGEHVMERVHRIQLERSGSREAAETDPPDELDELDELDDFEALESASPEGDTRDNVAIYRQETPTEERGRLDAGPTRRLDSDIFNGLGLEEASGDFVPLGGDEGPTFDGADRVPAVAAGAKPPKRRKTIVWALLSLLLIPLFALVGWAGVRYWPQLRDGDLMGGDFDPLAGRTAPEPLRAATATVTTSSAAETTELARVEAFEARDEAPSAPGG